MTRLRLFPLACALLFAASLAFAQNPGQSGPSDGMREGRGMGRGEGMGLPPGMWWKNSSIVTTLNLTADQQKRMDDIFLQSRIQLVHMKASLEEEQLKLEPLLNSNPIDQNRALAQSSRIADLRADLEKARARMLLSLRVVLTADQWTKLQTEKQMHPRAPDRSNGFRQHRDFNGSNPNGQPNLPPPGGAGEQ